MKNLIIKYIPKITIKDILNFADKNNIIIKDEEAAIILKTIKEDYLVLLSNNYMQIFNKVKPLLSEECYNKALELFLIYQKKYNIF